VFEMYRFLQYTLWLKIHCFISLSLKAGHSVFAREVYIYSNIIYDNGHVINDINIWSCILIHNVNNYTINKIFLSHILRISVSDLVG
jgi:hypothetical protein